jgi:hypothetical protein
MCPIYWLLIFALRIGMVQDTTIGSLILSTRSRNHYRVGWVKPQQHVFCAIGSNAAHLRLDVPANGGQLRVTIALAGLAAGVIESISSHDLRRAAARDIAHLKSTPTGIATPRVGNALGHDASMIEVTKKYVGSSTEDLSTQRVQEPSSSTSAWRLPTTCS